MSLQDSKWDLLLPSEERNIVYVSVSVLIVFLWLILYYRCLRIN